MFSWTIESKALLLGNAGNDARGGEGELLFAPPSSQGKGPGNEVDLNVMLVQTSLAVEFGRNFILKQGSS